MMALVIGMMAGAAALAAGCLVAFSAASRKTVALDVLTTIVTGALVITAVALPSAFLLDIALVYAILSFAAVLVVARYLERGI
jgi:multisubunit Na+/H+ antiporter MnhF subunit